jgi:hypothetical protein
VLTEHQLLEAIGVMSKADVKAAQTVFQETVTVPTSREVDEGAVDREDEPETPVIIRHNEQPTFSAIEKVMPAVS